MTIRRITVAFVFLMLMLIQLTFSACDSARSRANKIVSLRSERKQLFDKLYQQYGGSELSKSITSGLQNEKGLGGDADKTLVQGVANLTQGADRTLFEQNIRTVGSGENLITITDKAKQFFSRGDVVKSAKKIYLIDIEVGLLESKDN